jgi:hypothetical protein
MSLFQICSATSACLKGDSSELSIILEFDPKAVNERSTCNKTPLHLASQVCYHVHYCQILLFEIIFFIRGGSMIALNFLSMERPM